MAHQSRPGRGDFTTLEMHAERLGEVSVRRVKFVDDVFGYKARKEIDKLKVGEILVLENVRFCSEEVSPHVMCQTPAAQANTNFVRKLSSCCDFYVNDAFAVAHRIQPSVVAFPYVMPSSAGKVMEREVTSLSKILTSKKRPKTFLFGGAKARDAIQAIRRLLEDKVADYVLTTGLVGNLFLAAEGASIGGKNKKILESKGLTELIPMAKELAGMYKEKIRAPVDLAFQKNGSRVEASVDKFPDYKILDVGIETIVQYTGIIEESKVVVANGPCGVFEMESFALGTEKLLKLMAKSKAFSVIGGGHLSVTAQNLDLVEELSYVSTGGKATMYFLAGEKLPGIEALKAGKHD
ncbi:MAG: phosphoglycerate kinase, partial [Candidatus Hydrothermarchaeota archaeon]|nr:phosphoglycerate kinase [Candidatus Hydrothermarchaeota archaeon]